MNSPYENLSPRNFWRSGVSESHPLTVEDFYRKKFSIDATDKIATAGSCFAQHVSNYLQKNGFSVLDVEPPPAVLSDDVARSFGYKIYSARYGNIYTVRQLLQLMRDAQSGSVDAADVWSKDGRYFDALRPNIEPNGFDSVEEALALRTQHLEKVSGLFRKTNVFIFTLGLTEAWIDKRSGRVFPTAPGTIAGEYNPDIHAFHNFGFNEIHDDFAEFYDLVRRRNPNIKIILTVSPVPLTATASDDHVLLATTYSKSVLRSVAGALAQEYDNIDYFPSYEMIASPWSKGFFYDANMRSVNPGGVASVMRVFFQQHGIGQNASEAGLSESKSPREVRREANRAKKMSRKERRNRRKSDEVSDEDAVCEDFLLEAFAPQ
jgi:hypothetical protein